MIPHTSLTHVAWAPLGVIEPTLKIFTLSAPWALVRFLLTPLISLLRLRHHPWVCLCYDALPDSNPTLARRFHLRLFVVCGHPTSIYVLEFLLISASSIELSIRDLVVRPPSLNYKP